MAASLDGSHKSACVHYYLRTLHTVGNSPNHTLRWIHKSSSLWLFHFMCAKSISTIQAGVDSHCIAADDRFQCVMPPTQILRQSDIFFCLSARIFGAFQNGCILLALIYPQQGDHPAKKVLITGKQIGRICAMKHLAVFKSASIFHSKLVPSKCSVKWDYDNLHSQWHSKSKSISFNSAPHTCCNSAK